VKVHGLRHCAPGEFFPLQGIQIKTPNISKGLYAIKATTYIHQIRVFWTLDTAVATPVIRVAGSRHPMVQLGWKEFPLFGGHVKHMDFLVGIKNKFN